MRQLVLTKKCGASNYSLYLELLVMVALANEISTAKMCLHLRPL